MWSPRLTDTQNAYRLGGGVVGMQFLNGIRGFLVGGFGRLCRADNHAILELWGRLHVPIRPWVGGEGGAVSVSFDSTLVTFVRISRVTYRGGKT